MLIVQGANDVRVPTREAEQMVAAMHKAGIEVTYLLYPDEGHGIIRNENNRSFLAITEVFFGQCFGGRYSPLSKELEGRASRCRRDEHIPGSRKRSRRGAATVSRHDRPGNPIGLGR